MAQRDRERERERERRRRGKRKYGQAKLKHAKRGVLSCIFAAIVCVLLIALLGIAYATEGTAAPFVGSIGLITLFAAVYSLYLGIRGFKEREKEYLTCKIGVISSSIFILSFIIIFCRGLF